MDGASRSAVRTGSDILFVVLVATTVATSVAAQEPAVHHGVGGGQQAKQGGGTFLGGGVALALGSTSVSGDTGRKAGVAFQGIVAQVKRNGLRRFSVDLQYEPFKVQNPRRDERYSSFSAIASGYLGLLGVGIGWQERFWSGSDVWVRSDGGIAFQFMLAAPMLPVGGWEVSPALFVRLSGWNEIATSAVGLRVPFGRLSG